MNQTFSYQNLLVKAAICWTIFFFTVFNFVPAASAITQELHLESRQGYKIEALFSYPTQTTGAIAERGEGTTKTIDSLVVSFYDPDGNAIASYDNIVDGVAKGKYFEFNYNPATGKLQGAIDLGGESAGEMYLKGEVESGLSLIEVDRSGEKEIDTLNIEH